VALEHVGGLIGLVLLGVDPVVDHLHALGVDRRVTAEHVVAHRAGDGDDRVGGLEGGALAERGKVVAAAELFLLPRPQRLEAVRRRDVRDAVVELGEVAGEVRVPRVRVDDLRACDAGRHRQVDGHRLERGVSLQRLPGAVGLRVGPVGAEAVHGQLDEVAQLAREVFDVHAGAAVDLGRVFAREQ